MNYKISRRKFVQATGAVSAASAIGFPHLALGASKKVVVVGGGTGGATAAKYIKVIDPSIDVTLIEPNKDYYTCYLSNEVLSGTREIDSIKFGYAGLKKRGIKVVHDMATGEGLIIVNWGTLLKGKLVLLLAGSPEYQEALKNEIIHRL